MEQRDSDTDADRVTAWSILSAVIVAAVVTLAIQTRSILLLLGGR